MNPPIPVRVRDCTCTGEPHKEDGDLVFVAPTLSLAGGLRARQDIRDSLGNGSMLAELWLVTFVRYGAVGWNLVDADGDPVPFDVEELLADISLSEIVAEKCDDLYGEAVTRPLVENIRKISERGRTDASTSPRSGTSRGTSSTSPKTKSTRKPSRRSSPRASAGKR